MDQLIIESARALTASQVKQIVDNIGASSATVSTKVNRALLAGIKITFKNKVLDSSLNYRLNQLYDSLTAQNQ